MGLLVAETRIALSEPARMADILCDHLAEHSAVIERDGNVSTLRSPFGSGVLRTEPGALLVRAEAPEITTLYFVRMMLAGHIKEFARELYGDAEPEIVWTGDGSDLVTPPNFRLLRVREIKDITPHMRRITFSGSDLWLYMLDEQIHAQLIIPPKGEEPIWPTLGADGLVRWKDGRGRPAVRRYTIRQHDIRAGTIDIDFVLHEDSGPGSNFALHARTGDMIGVIGPGGGGIRRGGDWYLFAGDETALPAMARIIEGLPEKVRGVALIEVADKSEEQPIKTKADFDIRWLHRNGAASGTTTLLQDAVRSVEFPADLSGVLAWAGCEFDAFKAIRSHLRKERGLKKDRHLVVSYWRKGKTDDEAEKAGDDER